MFFYLARVLMNRTTLTRIWFTRVRSSNRRFNAGSSRQQLRETSARLAMSSKLFQGTNVFMSRKLVPPELFDTLRDALEQNGAEVLLCCDPSRNGARDYHVIASYDHVIKSMISQFHCFGVCNFVFVCWTWWMDFSSLGRRSLRILEPRGAS